MEYIPQYVKQKPKEVDEDMLIDVEVPVSKACAFQKAGTGNEEWNASEERKTCLHSEWKTRRVDSMWWNFRTKKIMVQL